MRFTKAAATVAVAVGLTAATAAPAQAINVYDRTDWNAAVNGYFQLDRYDSFWSTCLANAGKTSGFPQTGWDRFNSRNNCGVIEVRTNDGVYYNQPFEKEVSRSLGRWDTVLSIEIY